MDMSTPFSLPLDYSCTCPCEWVLKADSWDIFRIKKNGEALKSCFYSGFSKRGGRKWPMPSLCKIHFYFASVISHVGVSWRKIHYRFWYLIVPLSHCLLYATKDHLCENSDCGWWKAGMLSLSCSDSVNTHAWHWSDVWCGSPPFLDNPWCLHNTEEHFGSSAFRSVSRDSVETGLTNLRFRMRTNWVSFCWKPVAEGFKGCSPSHHHTFCRNESI